MGCGEKKDVKLRHILGGCWEELEGEEMEIKMTMVYIYEILKTEVQLKPLEF